MTDQEVNELAAILVHEHGNAALDVAEDRRSIHEPGSDAYQVWTRIAAAVNRLLGAAQPLMAGRQNSSARHQ
ncbi:MAG: hypothetical protein JO162_05345 [Alphaproteobacteria bacterium]|nr:hypothetical protein [Alphaproteobacteria bacterium]MBV9152088.1 hypothetical protein [Alphaproteobacteria bacterium]MBV9584593.1 hypothetical protein [Alphaproteobacteria bacterium]MBV9964694.1 hypothetical protein [Alphaproteobacteria bacterium]